MLIALLPACKSQKETATASKEETKPAEENKTNDTPASRTTTHEIKTSGTIPNQTIQGGQQNQNNSPTGPKPRK